MKLSIITTLFKSEPYLRKCLDSLLDQDLTPDDYELVIVNDGSPDGCADIVREYQRTHSNIVLVQQENRGLPEARNTGLRHVTGNYVTFVDPDDYVQPQVYGRLLHKVMDEDLDMLRFGYTMIEEGTGRVLPKYKESLLTVDYSDSITDGETFLGRRLGFACYVWQFLFRTSLFRDHDILFREKVFDDADLLPRLIPFVHRVTSVDTPVYFYTQRPDSLANAQNRPGALKKIEGFFYVIEQYNGYYVHYHSSCARKWLRSSITSAWVAILQTAAVYDYANRQQYIDRFHSCNDLSLSSYHRARKKRTHIFLLRILGPNVYCSLYRRISKR